jgi:hypothetical protein
MLTSPYALWEFCHNIRFFDWFRQVLASAVIIREFEKCHTAEYALSAQGPNSLRSFLVSDVPGVLSCGAMGVDYVIVPGRKQASYAVLDLSVWQRHLLRSIVQVSHTTLCIEMTQGVKEPRRPIGIAFSAK